VDLLSCMATTSFALGSDPLPIYTLPVVTLR
jgi:hypothetical protein